MKPTVPDAIPSRPFRFRFLVRGKQTVDLLRIALLSLARCHPEVSVVVVDANDRPVIDINLFGIDLDHAVVHVPPGDDAVASQVGRGSRRHLFHWRHSPEVRVALPPFDGFDVHTDADLLFLRPMDLAALAEPLGVGRIAAAMDESTLAHYAAVSTTGGRRAGALLGAEPGGPMWQTGLVFSDPADDGGLYDRVWRAAVGIAATGGIADLPDDDMAIFAAVLGYGGPLWHRALALGHDWNYISDTEKDPGVFGRVAHYGGRRAKEHLLTEAVRMFPPRNIDRRMPWGSFFRQADVGTKAPTRGVFDFLPLDGQQNPMALLPLPLCLTWAVPEGVTQMYMEATTRFTARPDEEADGCSVTFHVHGDGRLVERVVYGRDSSFMIAPSGATTITVICVGDRPGLALETHGLVIPGDPR
jgi:hypothetical protein